MSYEIVSSQKYGCNDGKKYLCDVTGRGGDIKVVWRLKKKNKNRFHDDK